MFTNGLTIALELEAAFPRDHGRRHRRDVAADAALARQPARRGILAGINASIAFIGCNGVDPAGGVTNVNLPEAEIKRRMVAAARRRVVLADGAKVGVVELARICDLEEIDELITDDARRPRRARRIRERRRRGHGRRGAMTAAWSGRAARRGRSGPGRPG